MREGAFSRSLVRSLGVVGEPVTHCFVSNHKDADLVFTFDLRSIENGYDVEKTYGLIIAHGEVPRYVPGNMQVIDQVGELLGPLVILIGKTWRTLKPLVAQTSEPTIPEFTLKSNALRILVIEDTPKHQMSARTGLAGHKLTIVDGFEEAMKILGNEEFDVVLTDLMMPMSSRTLGNDAFKIGQLVHYGTMLMIEAAHRGAKHVAVVTDLNHHADWMSAAFDCFSYPVQIEGAKVMMMHSPMNGDGTKSWAAALDRLLED